MESSGLPFGDSLSILKQAQRDLDLAANQLPEITNLLGAQSHTNLGTALDNGLNQLITISDQLSSAGDQLQIGIGPIADQAPELLGGSTDQIMAGITLLKNTSHALVTQLNGGVNTLPARNALQQKAIAELLTSPIKVTQTNNPGSSPGLLAAENLAVFFACTTALLALLLIVTRGRKSQFNPM
ncbi:MAG: hypothetical protein ACRCSF_00945 [Mycobacteriaceae bacterium]